MLGDAVLVGSTSCHSGCRPHHSCITGGAEGQGSDLVNTIRLAVGPRCLSLRGQQQRLYIQLLLAGQCSTRFRTHADARVC